VDDRNGSDSDGGEDETYFPFAIGIPGMNHVVHNLSADIDHRLTWWPRFWEGLKTVAALLTNDQRRKRVWKTCVKNSVHADMERNFLNGVPKLYEKRWGMIIAFITRARPLLFVLRRTWSQAAYQGAVGGRGGAAREEDENAAQEAVTTTTTTVLLLLPLLLLLLLQLL
jgi:hypothetical protein